jgi:hypothetical protein
LGDAKVQEICFLRDGLVAKVSEKGDTSHAEDGHKNFKERRKPSTLPSDGIFTAKRLEMF